MARIIPPPYPRDPPVSASTENGPKNAPENLAPACDLGRRFRAGATFMGGTDKAPPTKEIAAAEGIGGRR